MKTIENFCNKYGLKFVKIRYKHQFGYEKRKGYDIINPATNEILLSLEPCDYSNGDKWHVRNYHNGYNGPKYCARITNKFLENINPNANSFFRLAR